jgi:hypothetical protein
MDEGGASILDYIVLKGLSTTSMSETKRTGGATDFIDFDAENGITYYYAIVAVNYVGDGKVSDVSIARPRALVLPGAPTSFSATVHGRDVVLSWEAPWGDDIATITGFKVLRGTSLDSLGMLAVLPPLLNFTDTTAIAGRTAMASIYFRGALCFSPEGSWGTSRPRISPDTRAASM